MPDCHVHRIFEVISPLTVWHILTCRYCTIVATQHMPLLRQYCHNICCSISGRRRYHKTMLCPGFALLPIYFLYNRMNQKFQSCLNSPGLWVGLYNRTVTILEQLVMLNLLQLSETAGYYMSCPSFFRDESCLVETTVSNLILTLYMVTGTLSGQTQGVLCCQT